MSVRLKIFQPNERSKRGLSICGEMEILKLAFVTTNQEKCPVSKYILYLLMIINALLCKLETRKSTQCSNILTRTYKSRARRTVC